MNIEIVSHCWHYPRLLTYQISSLVACPPQRVAVTFTVFITEEDPEVVEVVRYFERLSLPPQLTVRAWYLPQPLLMRRVTGRHLAAQQTQADWVWFTDCDYLFYEDALDELAEAVRRTEAVLVYPKRIFASRTRELGDQTIHRARGRPALLTVDRNDFCETRMSRAIGGVQIARGDVVRRTGYCPHVSTQGKPAARWQRAWEDKAFRRSLGTRGSPISIGNVFRIRHSRQGRYDPKLVL